MEGARLRLPIESDARQIAILIRDRQGRAAHRKRRSLVPVRRHDGRVGYSVHCGDQREDAKQPSQKPLQVVDRLRHLAL